MPMKRNFARDLKKGDTVDDAFFIAERYYGKKNVEYLIFNLQDKTGVIRGKIFDNIDKYIGIKEHSFVWVKGTVEEYQGRPEIRISEITEVEPKAVKREDFVLTSKRNLDQMVKEVLGYCAQVENPFLAQLLNSFFSDPEFLAQFRECPAAKRAHQAYLGGLLEHTVYLGRLVQAAKEIYPEEFDFSLLMTGALLHDIGKIKEYEYDVDINLSTQGKLIGHICLGYAMVREKIREIKDFPADLADKTLHLILASHGELEQGSPVLPKIPEAFFLYHIDNLDAKLAMVRELKEKPKKNNFWSEYHKLLETDIYFG